MKDLKKEFCNSSFSHIYVEEAVAENPRTQRILAHFPDARIIMIGHYKDVFCRAKQNFEAQKQSQSLILAAKQGKLVYEGAPVCQSFGNEHFYYTSCIMNCLFDCEYCYLRGMYPSGNIVIFVNLEDIFEEVRRELGKHPVYLCVSYDTDLLALEKLTGFVESWCRFAEANQELTIEIRTKCGSTDIFDRIKPCDRVIFAYTLSPAEITERFERGTASYQGRLKAAAHAADCGFPVRLCFDPVIYCRNWRDMYTAMVKELFGVLPAERIADVSIGSFRISADFLKKMRRSGPNSAIAAFPYETAGGYCSYPERIRNGMTEYLTELLEEHIPAAKIFPAEYE